MKRPVVWVPAALLLACLAALFLWKSRNGSVAHADQYGLIIISDTGIQRGKEAVKLPATLTEVEKVLGSVEKEFPYEPDRYLLESGFSVYVSKPNNRVVGFSGHATPPGTRWPLEIQGFNFAGSPRQPDFVAAGFEVVGYARDFRKQVGDMFVSVSTNAAADNYEFNCWSEAGVHRLKAEQWSIGLASVSTPSIPPFRFPSSLEALSPFLGKARRATLAERPVHVWDELGIVGLAETGEETTIYRLRFVYEDPYREPAMPANWFGGTLQIGEIDSYNQVSADTNTLARQGFKHIVGPYWTREQPGLHSTALISGTGTSGKRSLIYLEIGVNSPREEASIKIRIEGSKILSR